MRAVADDLEERPGPGEPARKRGKLRERAMRTDSAEGLVDAARFIRRLLPGDDHYGDALSTSGKQAPDKLGRLVADRRTERPSAVRELGLGALQAWQALSEVQGRGRGKVDLAILFTDIVGFSSWALDAGDEAALELLRKVASAEDETIAANGGSLVKRLGDGSMSVFGDAAAAVRAALAAQDAVADIDVGGHHPQLRAGVHVGRPRKVGGDYLGVDVNVAARVGEAAKGGELLVSEAACGALDEGEFKVGRAKRLGASGTPVDLAVCRVKPR